jgi:amino acid transporter
MAKQNKFGTFGGVFVPSILTILGVIMYLRLPMIVGQAGLWATIGIIVVAHIISATTGLSVSSIATDKKVEAGGTYYMISRSLGLPIGGTLGLALFIGLSFSVSLYLIGFSESFLSYVGFDVTKDNIRIAGTLVLLAVTTITFISTSLAIKTQYFIMATIGLSLVSVFLGKHEYAPAAPLLDSATNAIPAIVLFGIFFPAVTGFEAGVSMSGDLKDPKKSIPFGSISAIMVGFLVYIGLAFYLSYTVDRGLLLDPEKNALMEISWIPQLVIAGIWGATLSSALGSILGAPRILQATAVDSISPRIFSRGVGKTNEPRNALLVTFVIAELGILIGELDLIARIVSIFFITTYGFLNLSCAFERWASADFRPEFKTPIWVSLLGAIACFLVMIQLDLMATFGASILMTLVFLLLKRKELSLQSGDTWSGVWASLVKSGLEYLNNKTVHNRNWRPNILLFLGSPDSRPHLFQLGKDLSGKLGMLTTFQLKISDLQTPVISASEILEEEKKENGRYFDLVYSAKDPYKGIDEISRIYGFSGVRPNTILMGWTKNPNRQEEFGELISTFNKNKLNSIFLNFNEKKDFGDFKNIDIWWSGFGSNLSFAISIIRFLTSGKHWKTVNIRLFVPINNTLLTERVYATLERIINQYRISIEIKVVNNSIDKLSSYQLIERESADSDLTIVGLPNRRYENISSFMEETNKLLPLMGSTLLINASDQFEEYDLELDEKISNVEKDEQIVLASIPQFMYPIVTEEINRLDNNTSSLVHKFFEKTFLPHFLESNDWIQNLKESVETTTQNFIKANEIEDHFRRNKAFFKIKNEFYFKITSLFEKKQAYKFNELKHLMDKGLEWYLNELSERVSSLNNSYRIEHHIGSFKILKQDPVGLKRYKLLKRMRYPFAKKTIPVFAKYKNLCEYYIKSRQVLTLDSALSEFELSSYKFLHTLKLQISTIDDFIDKSGHEFLNMKLTDLQIEQSKTKLLKDLNTIEKDLKLEQNNFLQDFLASYRRDIISLGYDLEEIRVNKLAARHGNFNKLAKKARRQVLAFPEQWHEKAVLYYNKLDADVIMTSFKSRVLKLVDDYKSDINVNFYQRMIRNIKKLLGKIETNKNALEKIREIKVDFTGDASIKVFKELEQLTMEVMKLVDSLPKELSLPHEDESKKGNIESVIVPISKISRHFFESRFVGQVTDRLEKTEDSVGRLIHEITDQMNLTRFSIDNLESEAVIGNKEKDVIIEDITELLREKLIEIQTLYDEICQQFETALEEAFDPLASYKIIESSKAFTVQLRDYQSRRIRDILGYRTKALNTTIMKQLARIWYSKSEGVLLAKRLTEAERYKSQNEKILDIVEAVTPSPKVMNSMPHYYKSLFSGRSNITDEFWVEMKKEEEAFNKAIDRYHNGIKGAILVTGERNCGKTNLCQHVLRKQYRSKQVFHIFPPVEGSTSLPTYERELGKVTGLTRDKAEIYNTLQFGSVVVFHDLELWWERSPDGLNLIKEIMHDIDMYSNSCLFVININIFAYELINTVLNLQNQLIGVIKCESFDSEELKALIMKRHQSSGLSFTLENKSEEDMTQLKMAKLFSRYFDCTKGNPGVALNTWLSSIEMYKNEEIHMKYPGVPDTDIIENLEEEIMITLQQIALHKRMDVAKLMRVFSGSDDEINKLIRPLRLNGLLQEKAEGVFVINPYVEPLIVRILKNKELL